MSRSKIDISKLPIKYCPTCGKPIPMRTPSQYANAKYCSRACIYGVACGKRAMAKKRKEVSEERKRMHERLSKRDKAYAQSGLDVRKRAEKVR